MRAFVLILMVALLPLRMWAAEGMVFEMAKPMSNMAMMNEQAMPADCPFMASNNQDTPSDGSNGATAACLACQLCGAVAPQATFSAPLVSGPRIFPLPVSFSFQSALPLRVHKPPIS